MKKRIIHYSDEIEEAKALRCVLEVVGLGRISEARGFKQFCFITTIGDRGDWGKRIKVIACEKRKKDTDTFKIRETKTPQD